MRVRVCSFVGEVSKRPSSSDATSCISVFGFGEGLKSSMRCLKSTIGCRRQFEPSYRCGAPGCSSPRLTRAVHKMKLFCSVKARAAATKDLTPSLVERYALGKGHRRYVELIAAI